MKKILCLSGGGVRGVAQLEVLAMLETQCGRPLSEEYDLIIGTSVGAINASIISTGKISMKDLSKRYKSLIEDIFTPRGFFKKPKYDRTKFADQWNELCGKVKFGESKTKLMITTVDLVSDTNIFYKSWHSHYKNTDMLDLVQRSFAAPLYFGQIVDYRRQQVYSDGGIGNANFPLNEAKLQAESFGWYRDGETVEIHAIGTLYDGFKPSFEDVASGRWLKQVMDYANPKNGGLARSQSRNDQIRMMEYICRHNKSIIFRYWDTSADGKKLKLDGVKYFNYYRMLGTKMAEKPLISYN